MTSFLSFLLKANLALILLYGFYFLFFRRDTFYGLIRWYMLIIMISLLIFPLIDISDLLTGSSIVIGSQNISNVNIIYQHVLAIPQIESIVNSGAKQTISFNYIIWGCWLSVFVFMLGKRLFQLACIIQIWQCYSRERYGNSVMIAVEKNIQPFSFFNCIFLNPSLYTKDELDGIVAHEQVHCRQWHTIDILLVETLVCICWFNPVAWLLRHDLKQNIEYYTDRMTLLSGFDRKNYQYSLLHISDNTYQIVNNFHFNNLKKRIIMMNKKESPRIMTAKYLLVIPALAAVFMTLQISDLQANEPISVKPVIDGAIILSEESKKIDSMTIKPISIRKEKTATNLYGEKVEDSLFAIYTKMEANPFILQQSATKKERVSGTVTSKDGKPLAGVAIILKGETIGTVTDMNGNFTLDVPTEDATLQFSFIDTEPQEIVVGNIRKIDVVLESENQSEEKTDETAVKLSVQSENVAPVLFIVDGEEIVDKIKDLSPNSIKSMIILKNEMEIEKYGEKGKNGVIIITTKK